MDKESRFFQFKEKHYFHLVDQSQLPLITAFAAMLLVLNIVFYLHSSDVCYVRFSDYLMFHGAWFFFCLSLFVWFITVVVESTQGYHTVTVRKGLRYGMALFIVSEVMFFFAFFWAFFHVSLAPSIAIGSIWPPNSIQSLDVWGLPLVNTLLLLSSGVTITLAHRALLKIHNYNVIYDFNKFLIITILLGLTFLCCQLIEYKYGITFHWKESVYGSTFFVTTGFHGLHVTIGTIFLLFCLIRSVISLGYLFIRYLIVLWTKLGSVKFSMLFDLFLTPIIPNSYKVMYNNWLVIAKEILKKMRGNILKRIEGILLSLVNTPFKSVFQKDQHLGFEAAAWYWHFVDVVWIFLFITVYWWGS